MKSGIICTFIFTCLIAKCTKAFKIGQYSPDEAETRWKRNVEVEAESEVQIACSFFKVKLVKNTKFEPLFEAVN